MTRKTMKFSASYEVPESVATTLKQHWDQIAQKNLEDLAVIGYRSGILTAYQVQLMLHHDSRWETEEFLHKHQCALHLMKMILNGMEKPCKPSVLKMNFHETCGFQYHSSSISHRN